jgi:hypothetical protein
VFDLRAQFLEFNKEHKEEIQASNIVYYAVLFAVFGAGFLVRIEPPMLVGLTVTALVVAHAIRVYQITRAKPIKLSGKQIAYCVCVFALILFIMGATYVAATRADSTDPRTYFGIFASLFLAQIFSMWVDFFIAHLVSRKT